MAHSHAKRRKRSAGRGGHATRRAPRSHPRGQISITPEGFGFVRTAEGEFFVPASKTRGAFDGDMVEVAPMARRDEHMGQGAGPGTGSRRPVARVVSILSRAHETLIGRYEVADPFGVVVPEDVRITHDIFTERAAAPQAQDGDLVRVRITAYPSKGSAACGVVEEVLGRADGPYADIDALVRSNGLETEFDDAAAAQAAAAQVDVAAALGAGYRDLRRRFVFTIDPADARDFDDAVSIEDMGEGRVRLGVHIADVSRYVPWGSAVDAAARRRATSVYLPDRVIPMLPEALSNEVCSLVPGEPRLALSVEATISAQGDVADVDIFPSVILSHARLSYEQAQRYIDAARAGGSWREAARAANAEEHPTGAIGLDDAVCARLFSALAALDGMAQTRFAARLAKGGMDFDRREAKVVLDAEGAACDVRLRRRTPATSCIEEAMICANECVARFLLDTAMPGVFRVHEPPSRDSLLLLWSRLAELPCEQSLKKDAVCAGDPLELQRAVTLAAGRAEAQLVSMLVLRAMTRAAYEPANSGHFGLASDAYCHFTSPIRRYPDLIVHRMVKAALGGVDVCMPTDAYREQVDALPELARHASRMERIAEDVERRSQAVKLVEYMRRFVGQTLPGVVSGVSSTGLYVELANTAEGVVSLRDLGEEYFSIDPVRNVAYGGDTGTRYRLGQRVRVVVLDAPAHSTKLKLGIA